MEGLHTVKAILQGGNWMAKIDLKDAFFMLPITPQYCHKLRMKTFQFNCLPFRLCIAPRVFTKLLKPVIEKLRTMGIHLVIYMDDMILMAASTHLLRKHIQLTLFLLENLGFIINSKKSILKPIQ